MSIVVGFAGGGGVESGLYDAGIHPTLSIEFDPKKPELSNAIADVHQQNFNHKLLRVTVQDWGKDNFPDSEDCQYAHFSPVCCNFSQEINRGDMQNDISSAFAIADFISKKQPKIFTIENVPAYVRSYSWINIIQKSLLNNEYLPNVRIINFADHGVPQSRKRFFVGAVKRGWFPSLPRENRIGWYEAIYDLIPTLVETELSVNQQASLKEIQSYRSELPYLIPRVGYHGRSPIIPWSKSAPTVKRSIFDDGKGFGRNQVWTIWDGKKALNCNIEVFRRLQGFPNWYQFSGDIRIDGSIIGNSVPPLFVEKIMRSVKIF